MKNNIKRVLSIGFTLVCAGVFIYASHGLITTYLDYRNNNQTMTDLQETFHEGGGFNEWADSDSDELKVRSGFDLLLEENDDLVGWVTVDGTEIDYPILQADNNNDYLQRDFYKNYNILGSIFMDFRNDVTELGKNTIVYGHRTKNGAMFEGLTKFQDKDFYEENKVFTFDTLYESYEAEIFAVYPTTTDFYYIDTDFENEADFAALLADIEERALYETDVEVGPEDQIITLSTCDYELDEHTGRFVVQAKLTKKDPESIHADANNEH